MKADAYFEKYFGSISYPDSSVLEAGQKMYVEFLGEYEVIKEQRHVTTMNGAVGIIKELNEKWNAVESRVAKKFGKRVIKRNVIWNTTLSDAWGETYPHKEN
jgi:hypothetical protein